MNKETNIYSFADECYVFYGDYKKDIEERDKKIERLNNIINELNEYKNAIYEIKKYIDSYSPYFIETQEENNKKIALIINNIGK